MNPTEMMFKDRVSTLSDDACRDQLVLMLVESTIVDRKLEQAERERDEALTALEWFVELLQHDERGADEFGGYKNAEAILKKAGRI